MTLATTRNPHPALVPESRSDAVWHFHLRGKDPDTVRAYAGDWDDLGRFCAREALTPANHPHHPHAAAAARDTMLAAGPGGTAALLRAWLADARTRLAAATVSRRLAAFESFLKDAKRCGAITWEHDPQSVGRRPKPRAYKDTSGPGAVGFRRMLDAIDGDGPRERRDRAILWLLFGLGLRRESVATLNVGDLHLDHPHHPDGPRITYRIKGHDEPGSKRLPAPVFEALMRHVETRGDAAPGDPMFVGILHDGTAGRRLSGGMIWKTTKRLGKAAGVDRCNPHAFRHAAATEALRGTKNLAAVQALLDHESATHTKRYLDNLQDLGREAADAVCAAATLAAGAENEDASMRQVDIFGSEG